MEANKKQPFDLLPGPMSRIWIGILSFTGIMILLAWVAINEEARMEEFTERFSGRSVETGAILFENNCSPCHGQDGLGIKGIAPALNNPQLFGYSYFDEIDLQVAAKEAELTALEGEDTERAAVLEQEIAALESERKALEEQLTFDYAAELETYRAQLEALDNEIVTQFGATYHISSPALFGIIVTQLQSQIAGLEQANDDLQSRIDLAIATGNEPDPALLERQNTYLAQLEALDAQLEPLQPLYQQRTDLLAKVGRFTALNDAHLAVLQMREQIAAKQSELAALPPLPGGPEDPDAEQRTALTESLAATQEQLDSTQAELDALPPVPTEPDTEDIAAEQRATLTENLAALQQELADTQAELDALPPVPEGPEDPNAEERAAINDEISTLEDQLTDHILARSNAHDALIAAADIVPFDPDREGRMVEVAWQGSLHDLLKYTIAGGRPTSASYWPRPMPAWAQPSGPLRDDQIENLVAYILNWDTGEFDVAHTRLIQQYAIIPAAGSGESVESVGIEVDIILAQLEELEANPDPEVVAFDSGAGQQEFSERGCAGCHQVGGGGAGPDPSGVATRAQEHADTTPDEYESARAYLVTSIVLPNQFVVPGFATGVMPTTFGDQIDLVTLSNLIAYLESLD